MATITENNPTRAFLDTLIPFDLDKFEKFVTEHPDDVDWEYVSDFEGLDEETAEKFWDRIDWDIVSERDDLSVSFIEHFKYMLDWYSVSYSTPITTEFVNLFDDYIVWEGVIGNPAITEEFVVTYLDRWNEEQWDEISEMLPLSENFIRTHQHLVNWRLISINQILSCDFIREFKDKVYWSLVSYYQIIDKPLFLEFKDRIDWVTMSIASKSSFEFTLTEMIDVHEEINMSIYSFVINGKRNPLCCSSCSPVHKKHFKPIKKIGRQLSLMNTSAKMIQRYWKRSISNPTYKLCRTVLTKDFAELIHELNNR